MSRARTIVVGASHWHVPLYAAAIADVHCVVGLSDEDTTRVRELAELWGAPVEADWRRLLELADVELAYVFGPHDRMAETCMALIERRIPFVVEKSLGTSLEQSQRVRRAAAQARVPATVPLIQRGGPADSWLAKAGRRSSAPLPRPKGRSRAPFATQRLLDRILKAAALPTHEQEGRQWASHATKAAP